MATDFLNSELVLCMPSIVCETWFISFSSHKFPELSSAAAAERVRKLQQCAGEGHRGEKSEHFTHGQRSAQRTILIYDAAPLPRMYV